VLAAATFAQAQTCGVLELTGGGKKITKNVVVNITSLVVSEVDIQGDFEFTMQHGAEEFDNGCPASTSCLTKFADNNGYERLIVGSVLDGSSDDSFKIKLRLYDPSGRSFERTIEDEVNTSPEQMLNQIPPVVGELLTGVRPKSAAELVAEAEEEDMGIDVDVDLLAMEDDDLLGADFDFGAGEEDIGIVDLDMSEEEIRAKQEAERLAREEEERRVREAEERRAREEAERRAREDEDRRRREDDERRAREEEERRRRDEERRAREDDERRAREEDERRREDEDRRRREREEEDRRRYDDEEDEDDDDLIVISDSDEIVIGEDDYDDYDDYEDDYDDYDDYGRDDYEDDYGDYGRDDYEDDYDRDDEGDEDYVYGSYEENVDDEYDDYGRDDYDDYDDYGRDDDYDDRDTRGGTTSSSRDRDRDSYSSRDLDRGRSSRAGATAPGGLDVAHVCIKASAGAVFYYQGFFSYGGDIGIHVHRNVLIDVQFKGWTAAAIIDGEDKIVTLIPLALGASYKSMKGRFHPYIGGDAVFVLYQVHPETGARFAPGFKVRGGCDFKITESFGFFVAANLGFAHAKYITDIDPDRPQTQFIGDFGAGIMIQM